ncbi:MAG: hypothetical protein IH620_01095 [Ignavibacterium sp.]|nr:hypothetical protein [Ignavibacterium sp.]
MKIILVSFLLIISAISCSIVDEDCLCTTEYRYALVTVVDTIGVPVDSLAVTIKDKDGNKLDVQQEPDIFSAGKYIVLNDSFTQMFCSCTKPEKIHFSATDGNRVTIGEFLFNTDECKCHINKVEGPDTLVLR